MRLLCCSIVLCLLTGCGGNNKKVAIQSKVNNPDKDIEIYQKAIELNPNDASAYNQLGLAYFRKAELHRRFSNYVYSDWGSGSLRDRKIIQKALDTAITFYQKAIGLNPIYAEAFNNMGRSYFQKHLLLPAFYLILSSNLSEAIRLCQKAIDLNPNLAEAYYNLALAKNWHPAYRFAPTHEVEQLLEKAIELNPNFGDAYFALVQNRKDPPDVKTMTGWWKGMKLGFNDPEMYLASAQSFQDTNYIIQLYERFFEDLPKFVRAYYFIGLSYFQKSYDDKPIELYEKALELDPNYVLVYLEMAELYYRRGMKIDNRGGMSVEKGNFAKALESYQKAMMINPNFIMNIYFPHPVIGRKLIEINPTSAIAHCYWGNFHYRWFEGGWERGEDALNRLRDSTSLLIFSRWEGAYDTLIQSYQKAIDLNPDFATPYLMLGLAYDKKGDTTKADLLFQKAIELEGIDLDDYMRIAGAYRKRKDYDKTESVYQKYLTQEPDDAWAYYLLGDVYREKGDFDKAVAAHRRAMDLGLVSTTLFAGLWENILEANGNIDKAIELVPGYAGAYYNMGVAYDKKGELNNSLESYKKAAQLGSKESQEALKKKGITW